MKTKKLVALVLVAVLAITTVVGTTLAYFTDKDNASNTFELGGVDITLIERAYENGEWKDIESPDGVAELGQLDPGVKTDYNKGIFTYNNKDDAYIRNYVAIEDPDPTYKQGDASWHMIYKNADQNLDEGKIRHGVTVEELKDVKIGERYFDIFVFEVVGDQPVQKGNCVLSMHTFWLDESFDNKLAEMFGEQVEIYTVSEAIQAAGLTPEQAYAALQNGATLKEHAASLFDGIVSTTNK